MKAMQQVVDAQSERLALYQSEKDILNMSHQDHSTGQGEYADKYKYMYISERISGYVSV